MEIDAAVTAIAAVVMSAAATLDVAMAAVAAALAMAAVEDATTKGSRA